MISSVNKFFETKVAQSEKKPDKLKLPTKHGKNLHKLLLFYEKKSCYVEYMNLEHLSAQLFTLSNFQWFLIVAKRQKEGTIIVCDDKLSELT